MSIGIILGAGIYVVIGEATGLSGNAIWLSFIIAATVATFTGLSYAELSARFPHAGAEYVYINQSFGSILAWLTGWLIIAGSVIGAATVAIGFSRYFSALFNTQILTIALGLLVLCGIILILGVKETASLTIIFTIIETVGLLIVIFVGLPFIGKVDYLELATSFKGVIEAGVLIFFGYLGFEGITRLAEETKNPEKNIPRAILISLAVTTIIYLLVGIAAVSVVPWNELSAAKAPLALVAERVFGDQSFLILSVIALFSTFNTALVMLLSGSRLIYGMAKEHALPAAFLQVSKRLLTPWISIIAVVFISIFFIFLGDLRTIANLTNYTIFVVFILVNAAVIYFRWKNPVSSGFQVPGSIGWFPILPAIGIITCIGMIFNLSFDVLVMGGFLTIVGLILSYFWNTKTKKSGTN